MSSTPRRQASASRLANSAPRLRRTLLAALSALSLAAGCEGGCNGCGGPSTPSATDAGKVPEARIELIDAGKEPRIRLQVGRWQGLTYTWKVRNESSFGVVGAKPVKAPTLLADMTFSVQRGTADPVIRERNGRSFKLVEERATVDSMQVDPKGIPPESVKALNQGLASYAGTRTRVLVAEDGELFEMKTELVGGVEPAPEEKEVMDRAWDVQRRFPFRLPPSAVGVGSKWRFSETIESNGLKLVQLAEMSITSISDSQVVIRINVKQHAPRQEFVHPFAPGQTALLEQFRGDGDGQLTIDRLTGIPVVGRLSVTGRLTISTVGKPMERASFISASVLRSSAVILGEGGVAPAPAELGDAAADAAIGDAAAASTDAASDASDD